jgi:tRNA threonylcarbamoyladenosine biosynthesis protein TsaB
MLILGIETSGPHGSIALCRDGARLMEVELENAPRRHAQTLVTQIRDTFARLGLRIADLDTVAVSVGPGSFTGLRVGAVCAKTLSYATGCRLAAVDTLEAIAANSPADIAVVHVIADALRGDLFAATYHRTSNGDFVSEGTPTIQRADVWLAGLRDVDYVTGPGLAAYRGEPPKAWNTLPEESWTPLAREVAAIGLRQIERGLWADCATLEPLYVRRSVAEEKAIAARPLPEN